MQSSNICLIDQPWPGGGGGGGGGGGIVATVPISDGQSHFFKGCPSKDLRISIVVPTTDIGYNDQYGIVFTTFLQMCPYFWFWQVSNYREETHFVTYRVLVPQTDLLVNLLNPQNSLLHRPALRN